VDNLANPHQSQRLQHRWAHPLVINHTRENWPDTCVLCSICYMLGWNHQPRHCTATALKQHLCPKNHLNPTSGETVCTGNISEFLPFPTADCSTSALPAPHTTSAIYEEELITGKVKVLLFGGGFGESVMWVTHFWFSLRSECPGKREATCPSGPMLISIRSNLIWEPTHWRFLYHTSMNQMFETGLIVINCTLCRQSMLMA